MIKCLSIFFVGFILAAQARAEALYISDQLYVPLRTGPSIAHRILRSLPSGEKVTVLEAEEQGFVKVRDGQGEEGYLPVRYLQKEPIAKQKLARMEKKQSQLQAQNTALNRDLAGMREEKKELASQLSALAAEKGQLSEDFVQLKSVSGHALTIAKERDQLKKSVQSLEGQLRALRKNHTVLEADKQNEGIKLGILAVVLGIGLGYLFPFLKPRRRSQRSPVRLR